MLVKMSDKVRCEECGKRLNDQEQADIHRWTCPGKPKCSKCDRHFSSKFNCKRHEKRCSEASNKENGQVQVDEEPTPVRRKRPLVDCGNSDSPKRFCNQVGGTSDIAGKGKWRI